MQSAGGLWRDEAGAAQLATLPSHGARVAAVPVPADRPVNGFENLALTVVRGWR